MATDTHRGPLKRTHRGFEQDLSLVMGDDSIRAIVELVTNADDAYEAMPKGPRRKIIIEIERHRQSPSMIRVKDRALSMSRAQAEERLGEAGGRTSGFEKGLSRRGLLGRGAKDIVHFGPAQWTLITANGEQSVFRLLYDQRPMEEWESYPMGKVGPRQSGTTVELQLQRAFTLKTHDSLTKLLSRHFALRPILLDRQHRDVRLVDIGRDRENRLVFEPPKGVSLATNERVEIPGYPGQYGIITLVESDHSLDDGEPLEYWRHSIVITSGRASYGVFVGKFRRDPWAPYLGRLSGSIDVPMINQLIKDFDDRMDLGQEVDSENPVSLLLRDRTGLAEQHPFMKALTQAIEGYLQPHLDRIRRESDKGSAPVSDDTKRRNSRLGRLLGKLLEDEEAAVEGFGVSGGTLPPIGLSAIPTTRIAEPSKSAWVTIRFRPGADISLGDEPPSVAIQVLDEDGTSSDFQLPLVERAGYYSRGFLIPAREEGAMSQVTISLFGQQLEWLVQWQSKDTPPIDNFMFESDSYTLKEENTRQVRLLIPWELVSENDSAPTLHITGSPSIQIVEEPGLLINDEQQDCAVCAIKVRGRGVGSNAVLRAHLGEVTAETMLVVRASGARDMRVIYEELNMEQRAMMSADGSTLTINAASPTIKRYLGDRADEWPGQDALHFRTMLAELITGTVARFVVQKRRPDPNYNIFYEHMQLMEKWLPQVHRELIPEIELR